MRPWKFKKRSTGSLKRLQVLRRRFARELATRSGPSKFSSRIGVVLSGGGARGAYEAGVLMAFQDAKVPTHIIASTSVGSINAASYVAHSQGLVGNAEPLVASWVELTPDMLGIDWSRYIFVLAGLIAASAGIGNFLWQWMQERGIYFHSHNPKLTRLALAAAGIGILFFADRLSYIGYLALNLLRGRPWEPDRRKAWTSLGANVMVWGFVLIFLNFTHVHIPWPGYEYFDLSAPVPVILCIFAGWACWRVLRAPLSKLSHRFLRMPLRTGLFANFERTKFLRERIPEKGIQESEIHVVMTATDLQHGTGRFFCNASVEDLLKDPSVQEDFVRAEIEHSEDMVQAAVASSAFTFAYEAVPHEGRLWTDGGIITNQPIRPALRLGADVLFLVMMTPLQGPDEAGQVKTLLDVGIHAVDILVSNNFKYDIATLDNINQLCSVYAKELGVKPEQLELEVGKQHYRYVQSFNITPQKPLTATTLDFDGEIIAPIIVQGYKDATKVLKEFLDYEAARPSRESCQVVRLAAERPEGNFRATMGG
ncbi:MAG TPA: patatin-like phospholipase family protein [Candidatus Solibacter sp.]|nr:patatin-like phospholipase family protein [Candidatus Solibacter sp.]